MNTRFFTASLLLLIPFLFGMSSVGVCKNACCTKELTPPTPCCSLESAENRDGGITPDGNECGLFGCCCSVQPTTPLQPTPSEQTRQTQERSSESQNSAFSAPSLYVNLGVHHAKNTTFVPFQERLHLRNCVLRN